MTDFRHADILIVDDDIDVGNTLLKLVLAAGYNGVKAEDGEQALEILKNREVDLVVTDIELPDIQGLELTNLIKKEHGADVIVMTGFGEQYTYEDAIEQGASDFIIKPIKFSELSLRIKRVLRERAFDQEREKLMGKLQELAVTDGLTKLYNSRHFYETLDVEIRRARRYGRPLSLLLFDIDKFKNFNDTYGHIEGDRALARIARAVQDCIRLTDTAFRYGGEEFTVLMPETDEEEALGVGQRVCEEVRDLVHRADAEEVHLTISVGVTQCTPGEDLADMVKRVDEAMYKAKRAGGNQVAALSAPGRPGGEA
ncbi:diguanylate cyclase (GGDEF) domain-containing protein [Desulfatibacillum alkenivorans DSM 16219]|jgi:diguanylate cyclase (GGDEF)-like protein|uniref:diguanylate cyclase n=1 Tax=Desulfatibacillum alkenivorans DSM 16219 TaxID=1121393 RepID=A0A1M6GR36_9BACT|nr:diguanylate cyclase [Desulfatibacillum alkenivorans]SHJ12415.1 diguanylate cyclase (GGDEF) domain-containing protein [Desulfatibacillum alkenivorans DSM 16219]